MSGITVLGRRQESEFDLSYADKSKEREKIARKTEEFLAKGGKIKIITGGAVTPYFTVKRMNDITWKLRTQSES